MELTLDLDRRRVEWAWVNYEYFFKSQARWWNSKIKKADRRIGALILIYLPWSNALMLISCTHKPYSINQIGSLSRCKLEEMPKLHFSLQQWRSSKHMCNSLPIHQYMRFFHLQGWITQFRVFSVTLECVLVCIWGVQGTLISINKFIHRKSKSRKKKRKSDSILEQ